MLTALRISDQSRVIGDEIEKDSLALYTCEFCSGAVVHHRSESRLKIGHFKHKALDSDCPNGTGETLDHLNAKLKIYNLLRLKWIDQFQSIELEYWINRNLLRPDIYIITKKGTKIAIEVQASALTVDEISFRTKRYQKLSIFVLWVLLFDCKRYHERTFETLNVRIDKSNSRLFLANKLKLKHFELFLLSLYKSKLVLWDLGNRFSDEFIVADLSGVRAPDSEFRKDGTDHFFPGKITKTLKCVNSLYFDFPFNRFVPTKESEFFDRSLGYQIPDRQIMLPNF